MAVKDTKEGLSGLAAEAGATAPWLEAREGAYLTCDESDSKWCCRSLEEVHAVDEVEAAFAPEDELAIRPLFHQLEKRVKAHVLAGFLVMRCR